MTVRSRVDVLLLSQAHRQARGAADSGLLDCVKAAGLAGLRVIDISRTDIPIEDQIAGGRPRRGSSAVICGYVPAAGDYEQLASAAAGFGVTLVNTPAASEQITDFAAWYPLLEDVTPRSMILRDEADVRMVGDRLGWPVFVKGAVKSTKEAGWESCVAGDEMTLLCRLQDIARRPVTMRGALIARQIAPLRRMGALRSGFPVSREYRLYLLDGHVIACVPYWDLVDPFGELTAGDHVAVAKLASACASRLDARLLCVDVAQTDRGEWIVVEVGDPQYTTLAHVARVAYYARLRAGLA